MHELYAKVLAQEEEDLIKLEKLHRISVKV